MGPCDYCTDSKGIYSECRAIRGWFSDACGNCKRNDHGARCSVNSAKSPTPPPLQEKEACTTARGQKTTAPKSYY